jgi:hypothetical protein
MSGEAAAPFAATFRDDDCNGSGLFSYGYGLSVKRYL